MSEESKKENPLTDTMNQIGKTAMTAGIEAANTIGNLAEMMTREVQKLLERTTAETGRTMEAIATNPLLTAVDKIFGLDWLMTFLGKVDTAKVQSKVNKLKSEYPEETANNIAHRLIIEKAWEAGRLGLLTNIIPPIAAVLLGVELIATAKLQAEMVYEIAAAYGLDLKEPARRGEVLAILGLSLGGDVLKTGFSVVEIIPGVGPVVGASTNAAMLYVLGQTACRFYEGKYQPEKEAAAITTWQQKTDEDWEMALAQSKVMDRILAYMVKVTYPNQDWSAILPNLKKISPSSVKTIAVNLEKPQSLETLLEELSPEFAPIALTRCYDIAQSNGTITPEEREVLNAIATKFELEFEAIANEAKLEE
jgi:uncharacterized protein (DUF697 family)